MKEDELNDLIRKALTTSDNQKIILRIAKEFSAAGYSPCRSLIRNLKRLIKSRQYTPSVKLQALKILKACANTGNSCFLSCLAKKLASKFRAFADHFKNSHDKGLSLFQAESIQEQNASSEFLILLLQSLEE